MWNQPQRKSKIAAIPNQGLRRSITKLMRTPQTLVGVEVNFRFSPAPEYPSHLQSAARTGAISSANYSPEHTPTLRAGGAHLERYALKENA